ncbi:hypothetical protein ZWY2020_024779 [Hordeum vulgare]|nr:hypothetical protein ZWY2020_024779 [Hordeum vulgare]
MMPRAAEATEADAAGTARAAKDRSNAITLGHDKKRGNDDKREDRGDTYLLDEEDMESDSVFSQRFTPKRLHELAKSKLNPTKRKYIDETGFGDLESISPFIVPHDLMEWLTMNIDTGKRELRLNRNKVIVFTRDMVRKVFNIRSRNKLVELYKRHEKCDLRNIYHENGRAPIAHTVHVLYKAVSDDGDTTKRSWVLLAITTVLTPGTGNMVPLEYWKSLEEIEKVIYMDHLIFPQATIDKHHLNYSLPRACFVQQTDFDIVWEYDKNKLSLGKALFGKCYVCGSLDDWLQNPVPFGVELELPPHVAKIYAKHTKLYVAELKGATNSFVQLLKDVHLVSSSNQQAMYVTFDIPLHRSNNAPKVGERGGSKQTSSSKASDERGGSKKNYSRKVANEPTTNKVVVEPAEGARRNRSSSSAHESNACNVVELCAKSSVDANQANAEKEQVEGGEDVEHGPQLSYLDHSTMTSVGGHWSDAPSMSVFQESTKEYNWWIIVPSAAMHPNASNHDNTAATPITPKSFGSPKPEGEPVVLLSSREPSPDRDEEKARLKDEKKVKSKKRAAENQVDDKTETMYKYFVMKRYKMKKMKKEIFDPSVCKKEVRRACQNLQISVFDLLFFSIVRDGHWIVCVYELLHKQFSLFDSLDNRNLDIAARNLFTNFKRIAAKERDFTMDLNSFKLDWPKLEYPFDCGYFGVSYFENFDGKRMKDFKKQNMLDMQKYLSSKPFYHPLKKVSPADAHKAIVAA